MRHRGEEFRLGPRGGIRVGLGPAELLLGLDARGDVGLDGDEILDGPLVAEHGLHIEMDMEAAVAGGELHRVRGDGLAAGQGGGDAPDGPGVALGAGERSGQRLPGHLVEGAAREAAVAFVDPLNAALVVGDDDRVVRLAGDEGELAAFRLAGAEGLVGALAGVDVLHGAEDPARLLRGAEGSAFRPQGDPEPLAGVVQHAMLDLDERRLPAEMGVDDGAHGGLVVGVEEVEPALAGGRHLRGIVADDLPDAGRAINLVGLDIPLIDADLGGLEGEVEPFVGGLEAGLDPPPGLVLGAQLVAGALGAELAPPGRLGEVDNEAEEEAHAEAGKQHHLRQVLAVGIEEGRPRGQRDGQALVEDVVVGGLPEALVNRLRRGHGLVNLQLAILGERGRGVLDGHQQMVPPRQVEPPVDRVEKLVVIEFTDDKPVGNSAAQHRDIEGEGRRLERRIDGRGNGDAAGPAGGLHGGPPHGVTGVVKQGGVLIALVRPVPARVQRGVGPLEGLVTLGVVQEFGGVGLPAALADFARPGPALGQARQAEDLGVGFAAEQGRDIVDRQLGGAVGVGELALAQRDPQGGGDGGTAHHDGQPEPARAGIGAVRVVAGRQADQRPAHQDEDDRRMRPEAGVGLPGFQGVQAVAVGDQPGQAVGGTERPEQREQQRAKGGFGSDGQPDEQQARHHENTGEGGGHSRHLGAGGDGLVANEQVVDPEVQVQRTLQHSGGGQQGGQQAEREAGPPPAGTDGQRRQPDQDEADAGIGRQGRIVGTRLNQGHIAGLPAPQDRHAAEHQQSKRHEVDVWQQGALDSARDQQHLVRHDC